MLKSLELLRGEAKLSCEFRRFEFGALAGASKANTARAVCGWRTGRERGAREPWAAWPAVSSRRGLERTQLRTPGDTRRTSIGWAAGTCSMVLADRGSEKMRNGGRSRGTSPNGHASESSSEEERGEWSEYPENHPSTRPPPLVGLAFGRLFSGRSVSAPESGGADRDARAFRSVGALIALSPTAASCSCRATSWPTPGVFCFGKNAHVHWGIQEGLVRFLL